MKDILEWLQKLVPWLAGLAFAPKLIVSAMIVLFTALALVTIWTPPPKEESAQPAAPVYNQVAVRYGVTLGWQLSLLDRIDDSPLPEMKQTAQELKGQIHALLVQDKFPHTIDSLSTPQAINNILTYYGTTDLEKHTFVLLGIAGQRTSVIGISDDKAVNDETQRLAKSAVHSMDSSVIREKNSLAQELFLKKPKNIENLLDVFEEWNARSF
jgi:hypothetical protein